MKKIIYGLIVAAAFILQMLRGYRINFLDHNDGVSGGAIPSMFAVIVGAILVALVTALILYVINVIVSKLQS